MSSLLDQPTAPVPDVDELECIWAEPARDAAEDWPCRAELPEGVVRLQQLVGWGWPAFLVLAALVAPAGAEDVPRAAWVDPAGWTMLALLPLGYVGLMTLPRLGFGLFAGAGALGFALGIDCRASAHHLGAWWIVETAILAGLACAAVAGFVLLSRR